MNIRRIAKNCHVATGTVYNYFPSKEMLVASLMLSDWLEVLRRAGESAAGCSELKEGLEGVYAAFLSFSDRYRVIFQATDMPLGGEAYAKRHKELRGQIVEVLQTLLERFDRHPDEMTCIILAESILTATGENRNFSELYAVIEKLLGKGEAR
ncbi:MAG: TetR/AcrR family transcriptional regulator [bacterium]|nr:TetR/AcrR family transcriptional regulator [bacterium]